MNVKDASNEWTIITNNHQRMTSREDSGDDSQRTTLIPTKNCFYPLSNLKEDDTKEVMDNKHKAAKVNSAMKITVQSFETNKKEPSR
jgi:hypothetical protein